MLKPYIRVVCGLMFICCWCLPATAQRTGGGGTETGGGTGGAVGGEVNQGRANNTGAGTGASGTGSMTTLDADAAFSNVDRSAGIGATGATGQGFSVMSDAANTTSRGAAGGLGGFGGFGGFGGLGSLFGNQGASTQSTQPPLRTRLRSAIDVTPPAPAVVQQTASERFRSLATRPELRGINVTMDGQTAVLGGSVGSERDRRMSELLMRLEPGIRSIDNRIEVTPGR